MRPPRPADLRDRRSAITRRAAALAELKRAVPMRWQLQEEHREVHGLVFADPFVVGEAESTQRPRLIKRKVRGSVFFSSAPETAADLEHSPLDDARHAGASRSSTRSAFLRIATRITDLAFSRIHAHRIRARSDRARIPPARDIHAAPVRIASHVAHDIHAAPVRIASRASAHRIRARCHELRAAS